MKPIDFSSGDLVADRRADYAEMLSGNGDHAAAAELMRQALSVAPNWAAGWHRLGEMLEAAGDAEAASAAWRECLRLDPADRLGAVLKLALAGQAAGIEAPPSAFVETLFDQYAGEFDAALVERLDYRVPDLIAKALSELCAGPFGHVLDLGCGTGLMGERLRMRASFLEGLDLSAGMLGRAGAKRIYDRLGRADLQTWQGVPRHADLIVAADVLLYVGALERLFGVVAVSLTPGGLFAFSVEAHDGPEPMVLRESRRFAHARDHVVGVLDTSGLDLVSMARAPIRMDRGSPVEGLIVVARLPAEAAADMLPEEPATVSMSGLGAESVPV
ncbi:MAG: methyltransferase domain-containing protein [Rhizobiaceae bacterium]|nr:methyltransferase domain-containing protein [Rhizobiaceae bacterium]MCV0405844.1 methyltransferase domain-containing protein [Rhizobiaceae bacterium]